MKLGIVLGDLNKSGAPWNYISTLTNKLADESDVDVYAIYTRGDCDSFSDEVNFIRDSSNIPLPNWHRLSGKCDLDLFHINGIPKFGHWSAKNAEIPVVATSHGVPHWRDLSDKSRPSKKFNIEFRWRDRIGRYTIDAVFVVSEDVKEVYIESAQFDSQRVITTYEAIDDRYFEPIQSPLSTDLSQQYILHVSKSHPKKNVSTILDSIKILKDKMVDIPSLMIAGSGWQDELSDKVRSLSISDDVEFCGHVNQTRLIQLYDNAEIFVFPSLRESFGLPNVEAMARETPVITSNRSAIPEIVNGGGILLDDPLDHEELAEAIESVLADDELASDLAESGISQAEKFTWNRHIKNLISAYRTVIDND